MKILESGSRRTSTAPDTYFTGTVFQDPIHDAPDPARAKALSVTFTPGSRTNWHTHPLGQTLYVTAGIGRVQVLGDVVREIRVGDVIWFAPGEKHWHGAAPEHQMSHIAIQEHQDGTHVEWLEPVSEADYRVEP